MPTSFKKQLSNRCAKLDHFWSQLGSILGGFWRPSWGQVGTKLHQNPIQKPIKKIITFWMGLGSNFGRFWPPTWPPRGVTFVDMLATFWLLGPRWSQDPILMDFGSQLVDFLTIFYYFLLFV